MSTHHHHPPAAPAPVTVTNLAAYTPAETIELVSRAGVAKGNTRPDKVFFSSVSAGCLLSFACAVTLVCNSSPWYQENAGGLIRVIGAVVFPFGFVAITLTGADLFTGTTMYTSVAALHGRLSLWKTALHWFITFFGNLAGALFVTLVIFGYGGGFSTSPYKEEAIKFATTKQVTPEFHQIFIRGIGCNWLVCLAALLAMQAKDLTGKVVGMWWPIFGFVAGGLDHVVANMFFIPIAIFEGAPISVGLYIWKGIIPALLGNIVGGFLMVAAYYWWMHLFDEPNPAGVSVDGGYYRQPSNITWSFRGRRETLDAAETGTSTPTIRQNGGSSGEGDGSVKNA